MIQRAATEPRLSLQRTATARWSGPLKEGRGMLSTGSGSLTNLSYSFSTRFESTRGTNPEELLGAAHAGCFTMAFANELSQAGHVPDRLDTEVRVSLGKEDSGWSVGRVHLVVRGIVPSCDSGTFARLAHVAKTNCPVSRVLNAEITLEAELERPPTR
jgi:osmotically inducible protein OsmC